MKKYPSHGKAKTKRKPQKTKQIITLEESSPQPHPMTIAK